MDNNPSVGRHRLVCGDATSVEDVATLTDGKKLMFSDLVNDVEVKNE